jgi:hypothetical protein
MAVYTTVDLRMYVKALKREHLPTVDTVIDALGEGLPDEWWETPDDTGWCLQYPFYRLGVLMFGGTAVEPDGTEFVEAGFHVGHQIEVVPINHEDTDTAFPDALAIECETCQREIMRIERPT